MAGCTVGRDYPAPIVDDKVAVKAAKDRMYGLRQTPEARAEANAVQSRHGSRKSGLPQTTMRKRSAPRKGAPTDATQTDLAQGDLFAQAPSLFPDSP
jgi:deoxyribodipyrimidine photo-lyase